MHQLSRSSVVLRSLTVAVVILVGTAGCHWFGKKDANYQQSAENRPLEVPPDLDRPNTEAATQASSADTQSVTRSSMPTPAASSAQAGTSGFTIAGERDAVFATVGTALAGIEGVIVASKAQLLGTYDVSYEGSNFLVRVTKVDAGVYISAVDPRGMPATAAAPVKLIAALKTQLGNQ